MVGVCSVSVKVISSLRKLGGTGSSCAIYTETKTKESPSRYTFFTRTATTSSLEKLGMREQWRSGVTYIQARGRSSFPAPWKRFHPLGLLLILDLYVQGS